MDTATNAAALDIPANRLSGSSPENSPAHTPSPILRQHCSSVTNMSPLVANRQSAENLTESDSHRSSLQETSSNGLLSDSSKLSISHSGIFGNGHARNNSNGSCTSLHSDGGRDGGMGSSNLKKCIENGKKFDPSSSSNILLSQFEKVRSATESKKRPASYVS